MIRLSLRNIFLALCLLRAASAAACPEQFPGAAAPNPPEVAATNGALHVDLVFRTSVDNYGLRHYCYLYGDSPSPTLRARPGDEVVIRLRNELPASGSLAPASLSSVSLTHQMHAMEIGGPCGGGKLSAASTNLHFHGMHIPPGCHQDDVLSTIIDPTGDWYEYRFRIPKDQPPGLYWYHPHPHGFAEAQVLGGASGALIVDGIEQAAPQVAGLPERVLVLRDQPLLATAEAVEDGGPSKDISLNYVPVLSPIYVPATLKVKPAQREFWRVLNAAADTYFDLQLPNQPLQLIAVDGAPSPPATVSHVLIPPGGRAEFIVTTPPANARAELVSLRYETGFYGESEPYRVIAKIDSNNGNPPASSSMPAALSGTAPISAVPLLTNVKPIRTRKLYFSETHVRPKDPLSPASYFITPAGQVPREFDMKLTYPNITVKQGTVEDWVIENHAQEAHAFHIHQLHFQVMERDGKPVADSALRDTIDLPFWTGKGPYPTVKLRMDFRSPDIVGTFLYHCHILEHEDEGMMGIVQVKP